LYETVSELEISPVISETTFEDVSSDEDLGPFISQWNTDKKETDFSGSK